MTIGEAQKTGERILESVGIQSKRIDTSLLLEKVTGKPRSWLFAHSDEQLENKAARAYMDLLAKRRQRIPLVHLTNTKEFYGLDFYINEHVLTPRLETETMVDYAIKYAPQNSRLIDVGTGSGAIAIAIAENRPDLEIWATDITEEALKIADRNAKAHHANLNLVRSDLFENVSVTYSTVVTNLPYLREDADLMPEVTKEPHVALFGGKDGLDLYRKLLKQLSRYLESRGYLFTECDPWQHEALTQEAKRAGLTPLETKDYFILGFQRSR